jgi:hypothetical protein
VIGSATFWRAAERVISVKKNARSLAKNSEKRSIYAKIETRKTKIRPPS